MQNIVKEINPSEGGQAAVQGLNNVLRADEPHVGGHYSPRTEVRDLRYAPQTDVRAVWYAPQAALPSPLLWDRTINGAAAYPPATYAQRGAVKILPPPRVIAEPLTQVQAVRISYGTGHPGVGAHFVQDTRYSSPGIRQA